MCVVSHHANEQQKPPTPPAMCFCTHAACSAFWQDGQCSSSLGTKGATTHQARRARPVPAPRAHGRSLEIRKAKRWKSDHDWDPVKKKKKKTIAPHLENPQKLVFPFSFLVFLFFLFFPLFSPFFAFFFFFLSAYTKWVSCTQSGVFVYTISFLGGLFFVRVH